MENKVLKIEPPEGYEIDKENSTFEKIVFKKIEGKYPMDIKELSVKDTFYINVDSEVIHHKGTLEVASNCLNHSDTREEAEAFLALMQLKRLCNAWNKMDGFVPRFDGSQNNHCIMVYYEGFDTSNCMSTQFPLAFKSEKTAKYFMETFADLLETAKPLL